MIILRSPRLTLAPAPLKPRVTPLATPFSPKSTFSTSLVLGNMVMMRSAFSATSPGEEQAPPPWLTNSSGTPLREHKNKACPPSIRRPAMGVPMIPRPMKPIFAIAACDLYQSKKMFCLKDFQHQCQSVFLGHRRFHGETLPITC